MPFSVVKALSACSALLLGSVAAQCGPNSTEYDFIIIGGGTAGLAVAARVSQSLPYECILVIEAGPAAYDEPKINIPGLKGATIGGPLDYNFTTVPQDGMMGRTIPATRGKVLGGSSALNLMTWDRGAEADYDAWEALGNDGWNWESMIAAMEKAENFVPFNHTYGTEGVGYGGVIQSLINRVIPIQQTSFVPALGNLAGLPNNLNSLGGDNLGVMNQPSNIRYSNWTRSYSPAYLAYGSANLHVMTGTTVSKITFGKAACNCSDMVATGVDVNGMHIKASKEVILSAGSISSPQLLELSGVGSPSVLSEAGIDCIMEMPNVGENLQDHVRIQNSYQLKDEFPSFDSLKNATIAAEQRALYDAGEVSLYDYTGSGYAYLTVEQLAGNGSNLTTTLLDLAQKAADPNNVIDQRKLEYYTTDLNQLVPEFEVIFSDGYTGVKGYPANTSELYGAQFFTLIGVIQHPFSRGSVHVNASDPAGKPIIDPNYLSNDYDFAAITEITKFNRKIAMTEPMRSFWQDEYEPGFQVQTEAQWQEFARNTSLTIYHPIGTCAMLPKADGGVVDSNLVMYGTSNLRIVDSSVIPILPSGHLQTMVYGIAERAAVKIIEKWG